MSFYTSIFFLLQIASVCYTDHYKGGTISWKPVNAYSLVDPVPIIITERHSWILSRYACNQTTINTFGVYNDSVSAVSATLTCISSSAVCAASLFTTISSPLFCTDFSILQNISTGSYTSKQSLAMNSTITIASRGAAWTTEMLTNDWSLVASVNLTPIAGVKINTSPITCSVPVYRLYVGQRANIQVLATDWDAEQVVRCRWSYQSPLDECGDVCYNLPNSILKPQSCAVNWTAILRPQDVANGLAMSTYVIAITAEDFSDDTSVIPYSSIPHQMLVQVYIQPSNACSILPSWYSTPRNNLGCFGVSVGSTYTYNFYARVNCLNDSIVDFITSSPTYMQRQSMTLWASQIWLVQYKYISTSNQTGIEPFCIAAIDNNGQFSSQYCMSIAVNANATTFPGYQTPALILSTASPVGTVLPTQRRFSIQANVPIKRPSQSGSQIRIYLASNSTLMWYTDAQTSPDVFYSNTTLVFFVRNYNWIIGETYFITLLEGVATANQYCGMESPGYGSTTTWRFTIWNSQLSSTTTVSTSTSTATTHTVTTRVMGTTTPNTLYTTTGLAAYTTTTVTTTTSTTSTSVTTTTTTSATTTTTTTTTTTAYVPDATVIYPKDMEQACLQPVTIATAVISAAFIPLHLYAMITLFTTVNANFQKQTLKIRIARRTGFHRLSATSDENRRFV